MIPSSGYRMVWPRIARTRMEHHVAMEHLAAQARRHPGKWMSVNSLRYESTFGIRFAFEPRWDAPFDFQAMSNSTGRGMTGREELVYQLFVKYNPKSASELDEEEDGKSGRRKKARRRFRRSGKRNKPRRKKPGSIVEV